MKGNAKDKDGGRGKKEPQDLQFQSFIGNGRSAIDQKWNAKDSTEKGEAEIHPRGRNTPGRRVGSGQEGKPIKLTSKE